MHNHLSFAVVRKKTPYQVLSLDAKAINHPSVCGIGPPLTCWLIGCRRITGSLHCLKVFGSCRMEKWKLCRREITLGVGLRTALGNLDTEVLLDFTVGRIFND